MANMSYCRFENTCRDLRDCVNAIEDHDYDEPLSSRYEVEGLEGILDLAERIIELQDDIMMIVKNQELYE